MPWLPCHANLPSFCIGCGSTVTISNGELKAVNHDLDHSTTQFLVGNVLSLTGGVDEVWMKPKMTAAFLSATTSKAHPPCLTNACSGLKFKFDCGKKRDPHSDDLLTNETEETKNLGA